MNPPAINAACREAAACLLARGWALPPDPRWDITDFGLGDFDRFGLVLLTLANEPEYCEKLMFAKCRQLTPLHAHRRKKEDIICRSGRLAFELWPAPPALNGPGAPLTVRRNSLTFRAEAGVPFILEAGERVALTPGLYHAFWPESAACVIGEVSTANNDQHDNFFVDPRIGRFPAIEEDEPAAGQPVSPGAAVANLNQTTREPTLPAADLAALIPLLRRAAG